VSTIAARSAWLSATTSVRPSGVTARPCGKPIGEVDGGRLLTWPEPPAVAVDGSAIGSRSVAPPVRGSTSKTWTTSPSSPLVGPAGVPLPFGSPETYARRPSALNATAP
jgi:hypothetical protein